MNAREKGIARVREVRKILEGMGHTCEGPGYKPLWIGNRSIPVHSDFFGVGDIISWDGKQLILHQVTGKSNKAIHVKVIQEKGIPCWLWIKIPGKSGFKVFFIEKSKIEEGKIIFKAEL